MTRLEEIKKALANIDAPDHSRLLGDLAWMVKEFEQLGDTKYEDALAEAASKLQHFLPIGEVKAIGLLEVPAGIEALKTEIASLKRALSPFAAVAKGIPTNWPGRCRLRIDASEDGSEYLAYHSVCEEHIGTLPTIDEWLEAAEAAREAEEGVGT